MHSILSSPNEFVNDYCTDHGGSCLRRSNPIRNLRLNIRNHPQQLLHDFITLFHARLFDAFKLLIGIFASVLFSLFVAAGLLLLNHSNKQLVGRSVGARMHGSRHLLLEFLELVVSLLSILLDLFLGFGFGVFYSFGSV